MISLFLESEIYSICSDYSPEQTVIYLTIFLCYHTGVTQNLKSKENKMKLSVHKNKWFSYVTITVFTLIYYHAVTSWEKEMS